jgi:hypothetical protein
VKHASPTGKKDNVDIAFICSFSRPHHSDNAGQFVKWVLDISQDELHTEKVPTMYSFNGAPKNTHGTGTQTTTVILGNEWHCKAFHTQES